MANQVGKRSPKKFSPTYLTSILMVALVLFILGLVGLIMLHFQQLSTTIKENVQVSIYLNNNVNEVESYQLQKRLETEPFVKRSEYISKEKAKELFTKDTGVEDFEEVLGFNPLPASIDLYLKAEYLTTDSVDVITENLESKYGLLQENIKINRSMVETMDNNFRIAGFIMLGVAILLLVIVIILIDSTVRLAMYSNRFLVKSMQLVGANRWFITKPYMLRSVLNGFISGLLAVAGLVAIVYLAQNEFPELKELQNTIYWIILFAAIIGIGVFISWISTYFAVNKYLRMKLDELY